MGIQPIVLRSMGYHGQSSYVNYDIRTGRVIGEIDVYTPYSKLPSWAKGFSDERAK
jgi:hypothetical protein